METIEPLHLTDEIIPLLAACALPVADLLPSSPVRFFGIRLQGTLVAVVGLELHPPAALLRSLAVTPAFRGRGHARQLVAFAESFAVEQGVDTLYLLTTTAEAYFLGLGFTPASRSAAPPAIQATSEFSGLCPASSAFLSKQLVIAGNEP